MQDPTSIIPLHVTICPFYNYHITTLLVPLFITIRIFNVVYFAVSAPLLVTICMFNDWSTTNTMANPIHPPFFGTIQIFNGRSVLVVQSTLFILLPRRRPI